MRKANMSRIIRLGHPVAPPIVRNEHIIARFYLNRFADSEQHVIAYAPGHLPRRKSTKSLSSERDYFEYTVNGEATLNRYEKWFGKIENDAAAVYNTIHAGTGLTGAGEVVWAVFVATMFLRSRKVREQIGPELTRMVEAEVYSGGEQLKEMQCELLRQGVFVYAEDLRAMVERILGEMRDPAFAHLAGIEENVRTIARNILEKGRWFVVEAAPGSVFITSDCPVQTITLNGPGAPITLGNGFRHHNTAIAFPLSPKKLFLAGPQEIVFKSPVLGAKDVVAFNTATAQFAHRAVYASERNAEIQALVDRETNKITFGKNAFLATPKEMEIDQAHVP